MRKLLLCAAIAMSCALAPYGHAQTTGSPTIKTRLDHLSGTKWVMVVSYLPNEITSITCETWTMLGVGSYEHQNDFTLPAGPAVGIMDASGFDGYCKGADSIKAHTDEGDFVGVLDRGAGNWSASTKLTFRP